MGALPANRWEKQLERHVRLHARKLKLEVYKFTSPGRRGVPDRMFINALGRICFLELKAPGKKPCALQRHEMEVMRRRGVLVGWSSQLDECKEFLDTFADL
jgi:hypothetical protein